MRNKEEIMSKKIVFIGPPGVGKTTLKKVFFEGESAVKLLEYTLEPTYGQELTLLKLREDIGVFDLSGQENRRWLETEEKSVFYETKVIILILSASQPFNEIMTFIQQVKQVRDEMSKNAKIYILIHKIDLLDNKKLKDLKYNLFRDLPEDDLIELAFTSIHKEYLMQTFTVFLNILSTCLEDEQTKLKIDFKRLDFIFRILNHLNREEIISLNSLIAELGGYKNDILDILEFLEKKGHIDIQKSGNEEIISLTVEGKKFYENLVNNVSLSNIIDLEHRFLLIEQPEKREIPPFIGGFIADKDGRTLLFFEAYEGALEEHLINSEDNVNTDIELIPMFISALEKFSQEINIKDLSGFSLRGSNLKMQIFGFDKLTTTIFINSNISIKPIEKRIFDFLSQIFEKYRKDFNRALKLGDVSTLTECKMELDKWIKDLNNSCKDLIMNYEIFDFTRARKLYHNLENLYEQLNTELTVALEKVKKFKIDLMKAILNEDYKKINEISEKAQQLRLKFEI
ncbi:MAG: GTPase domain-containing protein [Promethearchaeota archaeon]